MGLLVTVKLGKPSVVNGNFCRLKSKMGECIENRRSNDVPEKMQEVVSGEKVQLTRFRY